MHFSNTLQIFSYFLVAVSTAKGASVNFFITREGTCGAPPSLEYRNVACNTCVDPANDWFGAQVFDIADNQRVSMHNEDKCTPASQVGQWYGNVCAAAGRTALRSVWVACAGQRRSVNETENTSFEESAQDDSVTFIPL